MSVLIALLFVPVVMLYTMAVHEKDFSIASYVSGVVSGLCAIPFCLMFKIGFYTSSNFFLYSFSFFFFYFLLPSIFGLLAYYLFNFKSFEVRTSAIALAGIWTVFLFYATYEFVNIPNNAIYFILLLSYVVSILFFDFLIAILSFLPAIYLFAITYILLLFFSFASCLSFACWVFKYSPIIYIGSPFITISVLFMCMLVIAHSKKRSPVNSLLD